MPSSVRLEVEEPQLVANVGIVEGVGRSLPRNPPMSAVSDSIAGARVNPPALRPREFAAARHTETTTPIQRPRPRSGELWNR